MKKKILAMLLSVCLVGSMLAGCGSSSDSSTSTSSAETQDTASETGSSDSADALADLPAAIGEGTIVGSPDFYTSTDLSQAYTVNMYLIGDTPNDWDKVQDLINEYLEPFNTSIATTFMSWSDYQTMYSLVLTGTDVDLIFTAPWCYMYTEAAKGSFYELTEDFRSTYMPLTTKYQAAESWDETTISGKTIAVSSNYAQPMGKIVAIRQDIADKYGIDSLNSWDDYKNFMLTVAEKETPESGIYALAAATDNNELWDVYRQQFDTFLALDSDYFDMIYKYDGSSLPAADDIQLVYATDEFRSYAKDMKEMADAGCWSRSALTNTVTDDDAFGNLQGASIAWNGSVFTYMEQAEQTDGVECMAYDLTKDHFVSAESYSNNDMAISAGSKNPERAALVLDLIKNDTYLNRLLLLGIEGEHYSIDEEGNYTELDNAANYPAMTVSASWAIKNGDVTEAGAPERELVITDSWAERVEMNPTITFVFDDTNIASYKSAVNSVLNEYVPMLELGLVDDVDATLDEMLEKCEAAGLQQVIDEFNTQYEAWAATR